MTDGQVGAVCPQCGSTAAVHSIGELAALARSQLGQQPGYAAGPQPGYAAPPQPGPPQSGYAAPPQPGAPPPGFAAPPQPGPPQPGPAPGYAAPPRPGPPGGWRGARSRIPGNSGGEGLSLESLGDDLAGVAMTAATRFIGKAMARRAQRTVNERVLPALAATQQDILRAQIAIAERHPDLRACLTDKVIFLAGGSRVLPMPNLAGMLTIEQSDALVASLRGG